MAENGTSNNYHQTGQTNGNNPEEKCATQPNEGSSSLVEGSVKASTKAKKKIVRKKSIIESVKSVQKGKCYFKLIVPGFKIRLINCTHESSEIVKNAMLRILKLILD